MQYEQAVKWCGKFKRRGKDGIISRYEYDESGETELKTPNLQICFRAEKALALLHFEGSETL